MSLRLLQKAYFFCFLLSMIIFCQVQAIAQESATSVNNNNEKQTIQSDKASEQIEKGKSLYDKALKSNREIGIVEFRSALSCFNDALKYYSFATDPEKWANIQILIAKTTYQIGLYEKGNARKQFMQKTIDVYRNALKHYQIETHQRTRAGGLGLSTFLTPYTDKYGDIQFGIGQALKALGDMEEQPDAMYHEALSAYLKALDGWTSDTGKYVHAKYLIAYIYAYQEKWKAAAKYYRSVFKAYPDNEDVCQQLTSILHDNLFEYTQSYNIRKNWVATHSNDLSSQMNLVENCITVGKYREGAHLNALLLQNPELDSPSKISLYVLDIINSIAMKKTDAIKGKLDRLINLVFEQPENFSHEWTYAGTSNYTRNNKSLVAHREWLLQFIDAMETTPDKDQLMVNLEAARLDFKPLGSFTARFFDIFFYCVVVFVVFITFIDWLIGKDGRSKIKDKVAEFWLYLSAMSFAGLVSKDAQKIRKIAQIIFGKKIIHIRFIITSLIISSLMTIAFAAIVFSLVGPYGKAPLGPIFGVKLYLLYGHKLLLLSSCLISVGYAITIGLFKLMERQTRLWLLAVIVMANIILVYVISCVSYLLSYTVGLVGHPFASFSFSLYYQILGLAALPVVLAALIPPLSHIIITSVFIISKLFRPLIQKPLELILLRLEESDKGVLTLVATAIGILAKLTQEGIKVLLH